MGGPMDGVRVVEIGVWVAGPAAGGILADWGADVVKIEPPTGDPARTFQRMLGGDMPNNPIFELDNRSKQSIVLDLRTQAGRDIALEPSMGRSLPLQHPPNALIASASAMTRSRHETTAHLCDRHGYGLEGPDANRAAYDIAAFWARSGIASLLTAPDSDHLSTRGMGDHSVGLSTAAAISAALFARERTGEGQMVSTSFLRQGVYTIGFDLNMVLGWGLTTCGRHAPRDGQSGDQQLHGREGRRFGSSARRRTALAAACACGRSSRMASRRTLLDSRARAQKHGVDRRDSIASSRRRRSTNGPRYSPQRTTSSGRRSTPSPTCSPILSWPTRAGWSWCPTDRPVRR